MTLKVQLVQGYTLFRLFLSFCIEFSTDYIEASQEKENG